MHQSGGEFSPVHPVWPGCTMVLLGGGPSLTVQDLARLYVAKRDDPLLRVMAINMLGIAAPWADVLFFHDANIFSACEWLVRSWRGPVLTLCRRENAPAPNVRRVRTLYQDPVRFSTDPQWSLQGRSSGHTAINIAAQLGASRVILLGYDCRVVDGRSHSHDAYGETAETYATDFLPKWAGYGAAARSIGLSVVNATPGSVIAEFPRAALDDLLSVRIAA